MAKKLINILGTYGNILDISALSKKEPRNHITRRDKVVEWEAQDVRGAVAVARFFIDSMNNWQAYTESTLFMCLMENGSIQYYYTEIGHLPGRHPRETHKIVPITRDDFRAQVLMSRRFHSDNGEDALDRLEAYFGDIRQLAQDVANHPDKSVRAFLPRLIMLIQKQKQATLAPSP